MKITKKIIKAYTLALLIIGIMFFPIIPRLLNYPPDSINNEFQRNVDIGMSYTEQYIFIILVCYVVGLITIFVKTRKIEKLKESSLSNFEEKFNNIINSVFNLPYTIYWMHLVVPTIVILGVYTLSESSLDMGTIKIALVFVAIETLTALVLFIYCKNLLSNNLRSFNVDKKYLNKVTSLKNKIFTIIMPMILVALVFTAILGFSQIVEQKGEYMYISNKMILDEALTNDTYTTSEINYVLRNIELLNENDNIFIIYSYDDYKCLRDEELSEFFRKYTIKQAETHNNRTYDSYGVDKQGVEKKVLIDGREAYVGIIYDITALGGIYWFILCIVGLFVVNCVVLYYISRSIANDVKEVSDALNQIVKEKTKISKNKLPITSNDEIAQLVIAFNEIQELTDEHITKIEENQYTMQRQAQFAILGEFAGGLAHDLNSPLSAVKLDISTLKKYMNSDKISAEENVKNKLNEMLNNIDNSLSSMGNIIMGVRNQIRATGDTDKEEFLLQDVIEGIKLIFRSILMKNNCQLESNIPEGLKIYGEKNKLDRVIGNLVKNSVDAYVAIDKKGKITISAENKGDKTIIAISDEAGGIDEEIQDKVFKEIKTTKAEKGTGFGLYYSNTIIEGSFKGRMYFETTKGVGTTFYIEIPNNKED